MFAVEIVFYAETMHCLLAQSGDECMTTSTFNEIDISVFALLSRTTFICETKFHDQSSLLHAVHGTAQVATPSRNWRVNRLLTNYIWL